MLKGIDKLGKFYLHVGGIGDLFYTLSAGYDTEEEMMILSYANNPEVIKEILTHFPKVKSLVLKNNADYVEMSRVSEFAHSIAHLPKKLDYMNWPKYISDMKLEETTWVKEIPKKTLATKHVCIQPLGQGVGGGSGKHVGIHLNYWKLILQAVRDSGFQPCVLGLPEDAAKYPREKQEDFSHLSLWDQFQYLMGSKMIISCDSWSKNLSLHAGIPTIVLKNFFIDFDQPVNDWKDPADPMFIDYWEDKGPIYPIEQKKAHSMAQLKDTIEKLLGGSSE